jgi:hypothetical protein
MYKSSLRPATLFELVPLLFGGVGILVWMSLIFSRKSQVGVAKTGGFGKIPVSMFGVPPCAVWHGKREKSLQRSMQEQLICREYVSLQASTW